MTWSVGLWIQSLTTGVRTPKARSGTLQLVAAVGSVRITMTWYERDHQPHDCLLIHSGADQKQHQSSASLAFVRGIHRWPANSPHKGSVTWKMFPFDDVISDSVDSAIKLTLLKWRESRIYTRAQAVTCYTMLKYHRRDPLAFIPVKSLLEYSNYQSPSCVWNLHIWNQNRISQLTMSY